MNTEIIPYTGDGNATHQITTTITAKQAFIKSNDSKTNVSLMFFLTNTASYQLGQLNIGPNVLGVNTLNVGNTTGLESIASPGLNDNGATYIMILYS